MRVGSCVEVCEVYSEKLWNIEKSRVDFSGYNTELI
jgi:hypothetical protein